MSDLKEAAEAAFLLLQKRYSGDKEDFFVMSALATALMEPVQQAEPIGWLDGNDKLADFMHRDLKAEHDKRGSATPREFTVPVYTAPPQRKPLTDEEILDCTIAAERDYAKHMNAVRGQQLSQRDQLEWWIARIIEAAHGIGEKHD